MKKILFVFSFVFFLGLAPHAVAQDFVALAPIPGLTDTGSAVVNAASLAEFFNNLYKYLVGVAAALAVIMIIWGGLEISTQDSISKQGEGREKIKAAIFGLILVLSPALVFSIINPSILNLSLNLQELDTRSVQTQTASSTRPYTLSTTEEIDRPVGVKVLFSFEVDPYLRSSEVIRILNGKISACTNAARGPGIIFPASLQTTLRRFVCKTCEPGMTATPSLSCTRQNNTFVCGSCN